MSTAKVSRRYAVALFSLIEEGVAIRSALDSAALMAADKNVDAILADSAYSEEVKANILKKALSGAGSEEISRLIDLLCSRGKGCLLPEISEIVSEMIAESENIVEAEVISALDLDAASQTSLSESLTAGVGKKVKLAFSRDESILGGVIVRIGDRKIDYSIKSKLDGLRRAIVS